jgi:hypothetical protein
MKEIQRTSFSQESLQTTSFLLELLAEWYSNNVSIIRVDWEAFSAFFTTVFSDTFKGELQLSPEQLSPTETRQETIEGQISVEDL